MRLVGHGGEGEVWEARTTRGETRALKLVRPDALVSTPEVERRGRWLRAVDHPALVAVLRTGMLSGGGLDDWAFVEMPFLDGPSLDDAGPDPDVYERLEPLAEALDALHAGVWSDGVPLVHRDVKPANIIDLGDRLVLVDHSTLRDASAATVTRVGTPVFAAPEVPLGRAGPPSDVYAFAATAVALVTGARGSDLAALLAEPWRLDAPPGIAAALAADPRARPASCRDVLDPAAGLTVRLDGPFDAEPANGEAPGIEEPPPVWRWLAVLALIALAPPLALTAGQPLWPDVAAVAAAAFLVHLIAQAAGAGPRFMRLLAPPLAWAWLLADRGAAQPRRRGYARTVLAGALGAGVAGVAWAAAAGEPALALAVTGAALALVAVGVVAARRGGALSLALLPAWVVGASLLAGGALALTPLAAVTGRGRATLRVAWESLASVVETGRRVAA